MTTIYLRSRPEGRLHRARLRAWVLPGLVVGAAVPSGPELSRLLCIHPSEAFRHMQRVLAEDGVRIETRGRGKCKRLWVVAMPEWRAAA